MPKIITFPNALNFHRKALFDPRGFTAEKNSDGGTGSNSPASNAFQVERGSDYIYTSGDITSTSTSGGMKMAFNTSIGKHYWYTAYCGYGPKNSSPMRDLYYSPIYDGIVKGFSFSYKKYEGSSNNKHRFRINKIGVAYRTDNTMYSTYDVKNYSGQYYNLKNFVPGGTYTGTVTVDMELRQQPMGIYFQLETEGGGIGSAGGSYINVYNLQWISTQNKEAVLMPYGTNYYYAPPSPRPIWTE